MVVPSVIWKRKYVGSLSECEAVREFVRWACHTSGLVNKKVVAEVGLCVHEAFANIALHGYRNQQNTRPVMIECRVNKEEITIDIYDRGEPFDPDKSKVQEGRGLHLMQRFADIISFSPKKDTLDWNRLTMSKKIGADRTGEDSNL